MSRNLKMPDLNRVTIAGNLTRNVELRYVGSANVPVAQLGLAVSRKYKTQAGDKREDTVFVDVTAWRKTAEFAAEWLDKGDPVLVEGRLVMDTWEDKATGAQRSKIGVDADRVQSLAWPGDGDRQPAQRDPTQQAAQPPVAEDDAPF